MNAFRYTMIMQCTTAPPNRADASAHTAGWSESFWRGNLIGGADPVLLQLFQRRAALLPKQGQIVGFRIASYTVTGNQMFPSGSTSGRVQYPGNQSFETDIPQSALELASTTNGGNSSRFTARCIPDDNVTFGEYQPLPGYKTVVTRYCNELTDSGWSLIGRDLTRPSLRVLSIVNGVIKVAGNSMCTPGVDFIRLNRVKDTDGKAVTGSFRIINKDIDPITTQDILTVTGLDPQVVVSNSGSARLDFLILGNFTDVQPSRIVARKVGRPLEGYRGRSSRRARV